MSARLSRGVAEAACYARHELVALCGGHRETQGHGTFEKSPHLIQRLQLRIIHVDHHASHHDRYPLPLQTHTPLEEALDCQVAKRGAYWKRYALFALTGMKTLTGLLFATLLATLMANASAQDYAAARAKMADEIVAMARDTGAETGRPVFGVRVMNALRKVERHRFVAAGSEAGAYRNTPLAIGNGQTISQPYIVALMTALLDLTGNEKVLEIGTGSGYQAAVLAELAATVYTIEIIEPLARVAAGRLSAAGYRNIVTRIGDGYQGWREAAPFDAIMVTAAAREVPPALIEQLKPGGKLVIPVGAQGSHQELLLITQSADGKPHTRRILAVRFVPLTGGPAPKP